MDKEELKQIYASIHTLRMEGDFVAAVYVYDDELFQSTPSAWRVTCRPKKTARTVVDFNPHPPHGG